MTTDMDTSKPDEYYETALQIFDFCGAEGTDTTLRVDALMEKFAPFVKTNKNYSFLKSLLDPEQENPEISLTKLAKALNKYSESQKCNLDESFNLRCGHAPQDSDSGISTDGYQLLEELQSELREKSHLASQLRSQLEFTDRQHDEALAALVVERDSLRAHINMLREENLSLTHLRRDYDEACERLCANEAELESARRELDSAKRRTKMLADEATALGAEKLTLQELLSKSKEECHRVNEMYASRQSALLEENESIKSSHADLSARLQDQDEFLQQIIKEKVLLEMELKDLLNKSNQTQLRFDRSIDVSYTEEQMLTALDSINADTRFSQENQLLDEESFLNALKEDQGCPTNMSLFDEIRYSFSNMSRHSMCETPRQDCFQYLNKSISPNESQNDTNDIEPFTKEHLDTSFTAVATQTDCVIENESYNTKDYKSIGTETDCVNNNSDCTVVDKVHFTSGTQTDDQTLCKCSIETQTEDLSNNNVVNTCLDCTKCFECKKYKKQIKKLELDFKDSQRIAKDTESDLAVYENNLVILQRMVKDGTDSNSLLQAAVDGLQSKIVLLEAACVKQRDVIDSLNCEMCCVQSQTESDVTSVSTQVEIPCVDCVKRRDSAPQRGLRWYFWEGLKCLFQLFAVVCFIGAVVALYGVAGRSAGPRCRPVPWRWLHAQDLLDFLLRIEYVADVPM